MVPKNVDIITYSTASATDAAGYKKRQGEKETMTGAPTTWMNLAKDEADIGCMSIIVPTAAKDLKPSKTFQKQLKAVNIKMGYDRIKDVFLDVSANGWNYEGNLNKQGSCTARSRSLLGSDKWWGFGLFYSWMLPLLNRSCYPCMWPIFE